MSRKYAKISLFMVHPCIDMTSYYWLNTCIFVILDGQPAFQTNETEESPMLSQATGGDASPTLLQTNFAHSHHSDSGDGLTESSSEGNHTLNVTSEQTESDILYSQSSHHSSDMRGHTPSSPKLDSNEPNLGSIQ